MHDLRISIVTPSFNQAAFLERTIRSVLEQGYANLQYGVVDGGSTDGSIDIIERYRDRLDFVVIEPDRGQCDAINKGMRRVDGDVVAYLNSDDTLLPGALDIVGEHFARNAQCDWLIGRCPTIDGDDRAIGETRPIGDFTLAGALLRDEPFNVPQPAAFWRRLLMDEVGLFDETLHYCMDFEMWCRFLAAGRRPTLVERELATYRLHDASKTCSQQAGFHRALIEIERRYLPRLPRDAQRRLRRKIGYQTRMIVAHGEAGPVWPHVLRRPWWLGSRQVRGALWRRAA
jgi:glycosyltransferase involved in cell wall biosynthesis